MIYKEKINELWLSISELTSKIAEVRDTYLPIQGEEARFLELETARGNLFEVETALFEYLNEKSPLFGKKPDNAIFVLAQAAIENSKLLLSIAKSDVSLKTVSPDGKLTLEQNMLLLKSRVNDPRVSSESKARIERLLKMGVGAKRKNAQNIREKSNDAPDN